MKQAVKFAAASVMTILILCNGLFAGANAGPPHSLRDGDAEFLIPVKHSVVEVASETLTYGLNEFSSDSMTAEVTADYVMHNTGEERVVVPVAFVSNNPELTPTILFKDAPVEVLRTERIDWSKYPESGRPVDHQEVARDWDNYDQWKNFGVWEPTFEEIMFYFSTGTRSEKFDTRGNYHLEVTLFEIAFEPGEVTRLNVSYTENAAFITDSFGYSSGHNPRFQFYYLLEPAQYWKDFRDLTIRVILPKRLLTALSLEGFAFEKKTNTYTAHFEELPDQNLEILVYQNGHITTQGEHQLRQALLVVLAVGIAIGIPVVIKWRKRRKK